jgi:hypothetical protein
MALFSVQLRHASEKIGMNGSERTLLPVKFSFDAPCPPTDHMPKIRIVSAALLTNNLVPPNGRVRGPVTRAPAVRRGKAG